MLLANDTYPSDSRVRNEAKALSAAGHSVTVIAPRAAGQRRHETVAGVAVVRFPGPPPGRGTLGYALEFAWYTLAGALSVLAVWARQGIDVIHVHNPPDTLFLAAVLPKLGGVKLVFDHHDLAPELYEAKFQKSENLVHRVLLLLERWSCRSADRVVTANDSYRKNDLERNGVNDRSIVTVRNGPPLSHLADVAQDPVVRGRASLVFGYLGVIAQQDGVDHLLRALHHLMVDHAVHDWFAQVIGPVEDPEPLEALVLELGISEHVCFAGYQPDDVWRSMLAGVDICCVPDPSNPLNDKSTMVKLMEYMALGKPVVAYDLPENRVSGGEAALYAQPSDPRDMARKFAMLAANPQLRARLGAAGRDRVRNGLAWEYSATALVEMYATVASW